MLGHIFPTGPTASSGIVEKSLNPLLIWPYLWRSASKHPWRVKAFRGFFLSFLSCPQSQCFVPLHVGKACMPQKTPFTSPVPPPAFTILLACFWWRHSWWDGCRLVLWLEILRHPICNSNPCIVIKSLWKLWLVSSYCCLWQILPFPVTSSERKIAMHFFCRRKGTYPHLGFLVFSTPQCVFLRKTYDFVA